MKEIEEAIRFHGHFCPGLMIGYRAAQIALRELGVERAEDEELVATARPTRAGWMRCRWSRAARSARAT